MTQELSPAAQAVLDAAMDSRGGRFRVITALSAVVDQAHPKAHIEDINYVHQSYVDGWKDALDVILTIADELKALPS
jgi:hypothetical protein